MPAENDHSEWAGQDRRRQSETPWHLEKTLNLGHLLTTASIVAALFVWGAKMDTRLAVLENERLTQAAVNAAHDATDRELRQAIKDGQDQINAKLDKLLFERRGK